MNWLSHKLVLIWFINPRNESWRGNYGEKEFLERSLGAWCPPPQSWPHSAPLPVLLTAEVSTVLCLWRSHCSTHFPKLRKLSCFTSSWNSVLRGRSWEWEMALWFCVLLPLEAQRQDNIKEVVIMHAVSMSTPSRGVGWNLKTSCVRFQNKKNKWICLFPQGKDL